MMGSLKLADDDYAECMLDLVGFPATEPLALGESRTKRIGTIEN